MNQNSNLENNKDTADDAKILQNQIFALKSALLATQENIAIKKHQIQV